MCHFSFRNVVFDNEMKVLLVFRRHGITALFTDAPVVVNGSGLSHSTGIRTSGAARGPGAVERFAGAHCYLQHPNGCFFAKLFPCFIR